MCPMNAEDLAKLEHSTLRNELNNLKKCQITFLTFAVTSTGILLGLLGQNIEKLDNPGVVALSPLSILIPFWWIFFDKAKTISRIVGYYRILESYLLGDLKIDRYRGWENSLAQFRRRIGTSSRQTALKNAHAKKEEKKTLRYWSFINAIFVLLCITCILISYKIGINQRILIATIVIVAFSFGFNTRLIYHLTMGRQSYTFHEEFWRIILKVK